MKTIRIRENCTNDCSGSADNADSMYVPPQNQNVNISFASRSDACVINMNRSYILFRFFFYC